MKFALGLVAGFPLGVAVYRFFRPLQDVGMLPMLNGVYMRGREPLYTRGDGVTCPRCGIANPTRRCVACGAIA